MGGSAADRLTGLEEASLFAERRLDELHEQVLALSGRVEMLTRRLERVEHVVRQLRAERDNDDENADGDGGTGPAGGPRGMGQDVGDWHPAG